MLLQLSHFFFLFPSALYPPSHQHSPQPLRSCPWVVHISSLTSQFPILFLTSPCLFCIYHLSFLFPVPFPHSPLPLPTDNLLCDFHFCDTVPVLVVCLVCFCFFRFNCCEFVVILLFIFLIFFSLSPLNISYNKGLVMMSSFNLTLSGKPLSALPF